MLKARNPRSGELDYEFAAPDSDAILDAANTARRAQQLWAELSVEQRAGILLKWGEALEHQRDAMIGALVADTGRYNESVLEIDTTLGAINRWRAQAPALLAEAVPFASATPGIDIANRGVPYALVGIISPWNFPLLLGLIDVIPALLAGSAVLIKPSEVTPRFIEPLNASLDAVPELRAVVHCLPGDGQTGAELIEQVDMVVFTGSVATGKKVGAAAMEQFIPAFLELGGKDPAIVTATADIERAATALTWGCMANAGQSCLSIERCYVHASRYDELVAALEKNIRGLQQCVDDASVGQVGPIIAERQADILREHLADAKAKGAEALVGGEVEEINGGLWCQPTLLTGVSHDMLVMTAETFGPILPVMSYETDEEAIALANGTEFGLSAAVFAGTNTEAYAIATRLEAGAISVNDCALTAIIHEGEKQSFKASGLGGSRMGAASIQRFLRKQTHLINAEQSWDPWWFR